MPDELIDIREVSRMTSIPVGSIYHGRCGTSELAPVPNVGRKRLYSRKQVQAWIDRRVKKTESSGQAAARLLSFTRRRSA